MNEKNINPTIEIMNDGTYIMDDANMASLIASLDDSMEEVKENAPAEAYQAVKEPADQLKENLSGCQQAELMYGPEPQMWQNYQPMHQKVTDSLGKLANSYTRQEPSREEQAAALDQSEGALKNANRYLKNQLSQMEQRNQDMLREMAELRQELLDMKSAVHEYSPEKLAKCIAIGMDYLENAQNIREQAEKQKTPEFGRLCKSARKSLHSVFASVKSTPGRIRNAALCQAYSVVDSGLRRMTSVFDKGLQFLQHQKDKLTNKQILLKDKRLNLRDHKKPTNEEPVIATEHASDNVKAGRPETGKEPAAFLILNDLANSNESRAKATSQIVDFLVKAGKDSDDIGRILADVKVKAMNELKKTKYQQALSEKKIAVR